MHKYIRKYQDKNGKWVYVYHEHGLSPKNMTINEFPQTTAKESSIKNTDLLKKFEMFWAR